MNIQKFLDAKHGKVIGRVYMLVLLFIFNALIPIGAVMRYLHSMTPIVLFIGLIGSAVVMFILSTPTKLD
ncbi:MAG: hypothetical protein RR315_01835 [Oscillospiraceae bacterium]